MLISMTAAQQLPRLFRPPAGVVRDENARLIAPGKEEVQRALLRRMGGADRQDLQLPVPHRNAGPELPHIEPQGVERTPHRALPHPRIEFGDHGGICQKTEPPAGDAEIFAAPQQFDRIEMIDMRMGHQQPFDLRGVDPEFLHLPVRVGTEIDEGASACQIRGPAPQVPAAERRRLPAVRALAPERRNRLRRRAAEKQKVHRATAFRYAPSVFTHSVQMQS